MSVTTEKTAVGALFSSVLGSLIPAASANVYWWVLAEPYEGTFPAIVLSRPHYTTTELYAGGGPERGNDDNDPNLYHWDYYDALVSLTGSTVAATMDAHDAFLETLTAAFNVRANRSLQDSNGTSQCVAAGETVTSDAAPDGPYQLRNGTPAILSTGVLTVKQLHRLAVS